MLIDYEIQERFDYRLLMNTQRHKYVRLEYLKYVATKVVLDTEIFKCFH